MSFLLRGIVVLGVAIVIVACSGDDKNVSTASCSASGGTLTEADCTTAGQQNGCEVSRLAAGGGGCSFERCDSPPSCSKPNTPATSGDAGRDPKCDRAEKNGLFTETPPCADYDTLTINGNERYACKCGACPCGYECGSIALETGGFAGSVCAPPR